MSDRQSEKPNLLSRLAERVRRWFRRNPGQPEDPYACVIAPKKRPPSDRSAAAVAELDE